MPTFYCTGQVTSDELWIADGEVDAGLATLIRSIMGEYPTAKAAQRAKRQQFLIEAAEMVQANLVTAALHAETFSYAGADDRTIGRLSAPRSEPDVGGPWTCTVPLIIVRPGTTSAWTMPKGAVLALDYRTETRFLMSLKHLGWLESVGRIDLPSIAKHPLGM